MTAMASSGPPLMTTIILVSLSLSLFTSSHAAADLSHFNKISSATPSLSRDSITVTSLKKQDEPSQAFGLYKPSISHDEREKQADESEWEPFSDRKQQQLPRSEKTWTLVDEPESKQEDLDSKANEEYAKLDALQKNYDVEKPSGKPDSKNYYNPTKLTPDQKFEIWNQHQWEKQRKKQQQRKTTHTTKTAYKYGRLSDSDLASNSETVQSFRTSSLEPENSEPAREEYSRKSGWVDVSNQDGEYSSSNRKRQQLGSGQYRQQDFHEHGVPEGMSDTRRNNGKFFYNLNTESFSQRHPYNNFNSLNSANDFPQDLEEIEP